MLRSILLPALLILSLVYAAPNVAGATGQPTYEYATEGVYLAYRTQTVGVDLNTICIRFSSESGARVRGGELVSIVGADLSQVTNVIATIPGARIERHFSRSERELEAERLRGESLTRRLLPDLNLFARLLLPELEDAQAARERARALLDELNGARPVAEAWALPNTAPPTIERVSPSPQSPTLQPPSSQTPVPQSPSPQPAPHGSRSAESRTPQMVTPDFSPLQGYLYEPPVGIWADSAWAFPGGKGAGVKVIDIEWGWLFTHEDLKAPFIVDGDAGTDDHGTAVIGEIIGQHNGYGINGIAPDAEIGAVSLNTYNVADGVNHAAAALDPGDIFLMEVECSGPENAMPCEWWADVYAAIEVATALGVICVEAAGNGSVDLDDPLYGGLFDRRVRDSGAIMSGAGTPEGIEGEWFTNFGSRIDLHGWGSSIVTTCCGDLQGGDPEVRYTAGFNGTSGASPIVVGAVASLQGQSIDLFGERLTPALAEEILSVTGTPYVGSKAIGERPNLADARERLLLGFGEVTVTVRDGNTLEPLPGMIVEVAESGRLVKTGPDGQAWMQLSGGPIVFRVTGDFFYAETEFPFTVEPWTAEEAVLDIYPAPQGSIAGLVRSGSSGSGLSNARVLIPGTPLDTTWTDGSGAYTIPGIPENEGYDVYVSHVPGYSPAHASLDVLGESETGWSPVLVEAETFESGGAGYTPTNEWEHGTPTFPPVNPPIPPSGENCWGIDLNGAYENLVTANLTSPVFDLSDATTLTLGFHHYYWIESNDGGQLQVWNESESEWVIVEPVGGYPDDYIIILNHTGGYNGQPEGWEPAIFRLDEWAGQAFQFRFHFRSNYAGVGVGWYIDDVALDIGQGEIVSIDPSDFTWDSASDLQILWSGPNPSGESSQIRFETTRAANVMLELFNLTGEKVRTLTMGRREAGAHIIAWDGRNDQGKRLGSGIYFYRLGASRGSAEGRIVRIR